MTITCSICDGNIINKHESLAFQTKHLGSVDVPDIKFEECSVCHDRTVSIEDSEKIHRYVLELEKKCIGKLPIEGFITTSEAVSVLGGSKQAFSQNPKIKRGFIYSVTIGGRKLYNRKSTLQFKESKDGRFPLINPFNADWKPIVLVKDNTRRWEATGYTSETASADNDVSLNMDLSEEDDGYESEA